ncbi:MAG: 1,4-alpha-glucan branching protein GlgB [Planctomycetota bacterium]
MDLGTNSTPTIGFNSEAFNAIIHGHAEDPKHLLGPSPVDSNGGQLRLVRSFMPTANKAWIVSPDGKHQQPMVKVHQEGLFQVICDNNIFRADSGEYQIRYNTAHNQITTHDPYAFDPMLSDLDLYLFGEGNHKRIYNHLGAQLRVIDGVQGVNFAVWAPNAKGVALVGSFNDWDSRQHVMQKRIPSGVWEIFVPGIGAGQQYKYRITEESGHQIDKCDPYGFYAEVPPRTANVVVDLNQYQWNDDAWLSQRQSKDHFSSPMSIYEVHLGSWRHQQGNQNGWLNYRDLAHQLVEYCQQMGFTHLELMPISEHPFTGSWGYQTVGYFSATSRYGTPEDLMYLVDHCHQNGIGVIIDWVPAHFPKDPHGLAKFDGSALYEHSDPRQGEHPDWDTLIFNYGRNEVQNFLISNAMFWFDKYHIDGLRVDAVASMLYLDYSREDGQWVPNQFGGRENLEAIDFMKKMNETVHEEFPGVLTIAEESTSWGGVSRPTYCGGLGFSLKWNMGWMNDTLRYFQHDPVHRQFHHDELTFSLIYAFTENFQLPLSHDEVVHGKGSMLDKMPGDLWQKFANLRLLYSYMWAHPGKKLLFMGSEFGQWNEWDCNSSLQWDLLQWESHQGLQKCVADLNRIYQQEKALHEVDFESGGFEWIDCGNHESSILTFARFSKERKETIVTCCNFTPVVRANFRMGVPVAGHYQEIFNSDSSFYSGTNVGNGEGAHSEKIEWNGRADSIAINVPPLGVAMFKNGF